MKKKNRILKNEDYSRIIKNGKKFHSSSLAFYYEKNKFNSFQIGISVSKKVSKLAVHRNKIKRRIVAILNEQFNNDKNLNIVIIAKQNSLNKNYLELQEEIIKFLSKI